MHSPSGNKVASEPAKVMEAPITITVQPQHVVGTVGRQYTMTVAAKGSGFTYQWQWRADSSCAWDTCPLTGNQTATMTIPCSVDRIGNQYRCIITDANGNSVASDYGEMRLADNNWTFTYDANGMRTSRTNGVTTYGYIYNGDKLSKMSVPYHTMEFTYDANGNPFSLIYNGNTYYYITNLQGDVVSIVNVSGTKVVNYTYDAWGKVLTITGPLALSIGHLNPLRYRGYVYDPETKLYYLQSRYYNPEIGRFLSHDVVFDYDVGLQGFDLFAYCGNNPVNRIDVSGLDSVQVDADEENVDDEVPNGGLTTGGPTQQGTSIASCPGYRVGSNNYAGTSGKTEIHHVVEQCQTTKSGFPDSQIQADSNKVALDYSVHRAISGHYSSKPDFTNGLRVRDWLAGQSFEFQTEYGWKVTNYFYALLCK